MTARQTMLARLRATLAVPPGRWWVLFGFVLLLVLIGSAIKHVEKTQKLARDGTQTKTAFLRWRGQIQDLAAGADVYRQYNYPNPPIQGLILWPLAELPPMAGSIAWYALKAAMAVLALIWSFRLCGSERRPPPWWATMLAVSLSMHPILGDLSHGNVNIFIAFLVIGALEAFRRGRDVVAGVALALAIACKLTPALFLPYFGWKMVLAAASAYRAGRPVLPAVLGSGGAVLTSCLAGLALWLLVVPGAALGWGHNLSLLGRWYDGMVRPFVVEGRVTSEHANQSIPGVVFRLLTSKPSDLEYDEETGRPFPSEFHNFVDLDSASARWVIRVFQAAWVLAILALCRAPLAGPGGRRDGVRLAAEFALVLLGMLLFSERTWKHHGVTLMLPFAVLATALAAYRPGTTVRQLTCGVLALVAILTLVPSSLGGEAQDLALTYGSHTAAFLLLTAAVCAVLWTEKRGASPQDVR